MADAIKTPTPARSKLAIALGSTLVAASALVFTASNEGVSLTPYRDHLAADVNTVCYGDTHAAMRRYSLDECKALLDGRLAEYVPPVRAAIPGFDSLTTGQRIAALDFAYNVGVGNFKGSTLRRMYAARQFPAACDQYLRWNLSDGKDCRVAANNCGGIIRRRQAARALCRGETP